MKRLLFVAISPLLAVAFESGHYYSCKPEVLFVKTPSGKVRPVPVDQKVLKQLGPFRNVEVGLFPKEGKKGVTEEFVVKVKGEKKVKEIEYFPRVREGNLVIFVNPSSSGILSYDTTQPDSVAIQLFQNTIVVYSCSK